MTEATETLAGSIRTLTLITKAVEEAEHDLKHLKADKVKAEQKVYETMLDAEMNRVTIDGVTCKLDTAPRVRPAPGHTDAVISWIIENGGSDLIKPSMHHMSRDRFLREQFVDENGAINIPEDLQDMVIGESFPVLKVTR